jgi:AcrR family transcriptional regulator
MESDVKPAQGSRSQQRYEQVLDAASECFRRNGFHGASIAEISKLARMSPGHIYHFFENKEAIIAAIVDRKIQGWIKLLGDIEQEEDVFASMTQLERIETGVAERTASEFAGLWLEVQSEAARNPRIAAIVHEADARVRARLIQVMRIAREARGIVSTASDDAMVEVIMASFEGLANRAVMNPGFATRDVARVLQVAIRAALEA